MMFECNRCREHGLFFERQYAPEDAIVGHPTAPVWIIGLNPRGPEGYNPRNETAEYLRAYFQSGNVHRYYDDFQKVSPRLFNLLGDPRGVSSTDLVKCCSEAFPPKTTGRGGATFLVQQCTQYLENQIRKFKPRVLICNGAAVSDAIKKRFPPTGMQDEKSLTSYQVTLPDIDFAVVLSGFIKRIDDYVKRRLGQEIEKHLDHYGID
jgi:hypothetical protein